MIDFALKAEEDPEGRMGSRLLLKPETCLNKGFAELYPPRPYGGYRSLACELELEALLQKRLGNDLESDGRLLRHASKLLLATLHIYLK